MSEVDDAIAAARASWARIGMDEGTPAPRRRRRAHRAGPGKRLARILAAFVLILVAAGFFGALVAPLGMMGALLVMLLLVAATVFFAVWPPENPAPPPPDRLRTVDLKALPAQTERWLQAQRMALPAPAQHLVDRIGDRLDTLSPQLGKVEADGALGEEIRRLVGEQLPAFVTDYTRVPEPLRATPRNGRTADQGLIDGLALIEREIAGMTERLAQDDLDSLQTRGRYLELKYNEPEPGA